MRSLLPLACLAGVVAAQGTSPVAAVAPVARPAGSMAIATSPDGRLEVAVTTDVDGRAMWSLSRAGKALIAPSQLGFLFTDQQQFNRGLAVSVVGRDTSDTSWTQPWGEWRTIRDHHTTMRVRLTETWGLKRSIDVEFRLQDDGVGFRYIFPEAWKTVSIAEELTRFAVAEEATAWWKPAFEWNREEYLYARTPLRAVGTAATPITIKLADGTHLAIHEAALVDYSAMTLAKVGDSNTLKAVLTPGSGAPKVTRTAPFATPWRTVIVTPDAAGLYMSHLMLNLNEPNRLGDVSWVRPGKFMGVWWNMISGKWSWSVGPQHGATTAHVKQYIDFASANGIPGVLVEGWNLGWDGATPMQFDRPTPDFDAAALQAYAKRKRVYLIGHNETNGDAGNYDAQLDRAFAYAAGHAIPVVKTGYVAEAGQIERPGRDGQQRREWHEGQWMVNHHARVVAAGAKYKVAIDAHEPVKGTGLQRTWPNWVAREGARGNEYMSWQDKNPPEHEANLVFTRMLEGPMDFTPGLLGLKGSDNSDIPSTIAKQLALYVVIYSPVAMAADTPEAYAANARAFRFIRDVPTDWEETRVLNGEVGDYVTIARRDRRSRDWYLGAITDETARTLTVPLDFLEPGRKYEAQIYRDGEGATYATEARHRIAFETRIVRRGERLELALAPGGGQAIRFRAR